MRGSVLMSSGSSYIAGGGVISVSVCRVIFSDLLHLFTANTMRRLMDTPRTKNVAATEREILVSSDEVTIRREVIA